MRIDRIGVFPIVLPFAVAFPHALSQGIAAANVVVQIRAEGGRIIGYGEGAPREFVTGESQDTVCRRIAGWTAQPDFPWDVESLDAIWGWVNGRTAHRGHNAALCAMETALLDAWAKVAARPLASFFPQTHRQPAVVYGAAIPLGAPDMVTRLCRIIAGMQIRRVKLKWGRDRRQNRDNIEALVAVMGPGADIKVDVNGAWDRRLALDHLALIETRGIKVVEQPLAPHDPDIALLAPRFRAAGARLMADESVCTLSEAESACGPAGHDMVNIRLSKCGGLHRCWRLAEHCRRRAIAFQIGCQLGESGILSAAGRALSLVCGDARYHDGSYDRFLLKENPAQDVSFGPGGNAAPLEGPGLGVGVDPDRLTRLSDSRRCLTLRRP